MKAMKGEINTRTPLTTPCKWSRRFAGSIAPFIAGFLPYEAMPNHSCLRMSLSAYFTACRAVKISNGRLSVSRPIRSPSYTLSRLVQAVKIIERFNAGWCAYIRTKYQVNNPSASTGRPLRNGALTLCDAVHLSHCKLVHGRHG